MTAAELTQQAIASAQLGKLEASLRLFTEAVTICPADSDAWLNLGVCCLSLDDLDTASDAFTRSMQLNPANSAAYANLVAVWVAKTKLDKALSIVESGLLATNNHPHLLAIQEALLAQLQYGWRQPMASKRLRLEPVNTEHAADLFTLSNHQQAWTFYNPQGISAVSTAEMQQEIQRRYPITLSPPAELAWAVYRQGHTASEFLGLCQLVQIDHRNRRAELLMMLNTCGQGYGVELLMLVLEAFFNRFGFNKLLAYVVDDNQTVLDMCLRLGFKQEGYLQQHLFDPVTKHYSGLFQLALLQADYRHSAICHKFKQRFLKT